MSETIIPAGPGYWLHEFCDLYDDDGKLSAGGFPGIYSTRYRIVAWRVQGDDKAWIWEAYPVVIADLPIWQDDPHLLAIEDSEGWFYWLDEYGRPQTREEIGKEGLNRLAWRNEQDKKEREEAKAKKATA